MNFSIKPWCYFALILFSACTIKSNANDSIKLGAPFCNNAVLQRGMPVPIWGWAKPGIKITVEFAGQKQTSTSDSHGKWALSLNSLKANFEPREMIVSNAAGSKVTIKNILVGEVWLASGQSNMQWKVAKSSTNKLAQDFTKQTAGKTAPIREFEITSVFAMLHPIEKAEGAWKDGDYGNHSAIAFAFALRLHNELNVPIGILNCSFSQTAIQAWVPREGFRDGKDEYTQSIYQKIRETDPATSQHQKAWNTFYQNIQTTLNENSQRVQKGQTPQAISTITPGNMNGNRDATWLFNGRLNPVIPFAIRGAIWNQGYANMGEGLPYYNNLHSLVRGWRLVWGKPKLPVYFHQFYCPNQKGGWNNAPSIGSTAEMRLGTSLARDIPSTAMASQIDISGAIHYWNKAVPGQRLALHALKNQYGQKLVTDGPMFKSYKVDGNKVIVEFDHAIGGLVVADTSYNANRSNKDGTGFADPKIIKNGDDQVKLFYLADENRIWHPANMQIDGSQVILTSSKTKSPRGVSYGTAGIGFQPNLYNRALLPMTPFIEYENKTVTSNTWPDEKLKIAGQIPDPGAEGKLAEWYKMPLLSTQFRDNAVLQAGKPITFWGSVLHDHGFQAAGKSEIKFSFAGINKTIKVEDDSPNIVKLGPGQNRFSWGKEWRVTVPPMKASSKPKTLKVTFLIDGEIAHQRICHNVIIGDVWFVAAPPFKFNLTGEKESAIPVRMIRRKAQRFTHQAPSRYSVCVSRTPKNRFACEWTEATGFAKAIGNRLAETSGRPVGIIFMQSGMNSLGKGKPSKNLITIKSWIPVPDLKNAASLMDDYKDLATVLPGNQYYNANINRYVTDWKQYWSDYIPTMKATRAVPDGVPWGSYPTLSSSITSKASQAYNVMVHSFTPTELTGIIFLASPEMFEPDQGMNYGEEISVLANSWRKRFASQDSQFIYTIAGENLAPKITRPTRIIGQHKAIEINEWSTIAKTVLEQMGN